VRFVVVVSGILLLGCGHVFSVDAVLPYDNGFESYDLGALSTGGTEWSVANGGAVVSSSPVMTGLGTKSLKLTNGVMPVALALTVDTTGSGYTNVWCRFYAKPTGYDDAGGKPTNTADNMCVFFVNTGGWVKAYNGNVWWTNNFRLDTNKWTGFAVHMNYKNKLWDLYVSTNETFNETMRKVNTTPLAFCYDVSGTKLQKVKVTGEAVIDGMLLSKAFTTNTMTQTTLASDTRYASRIELGTVPLLKYTAPDDTMAGALGEALKAGMKGDVGGGDSVRIFHTNGWNIYELDSAMTWGAVTGAPLASLHLAPGQGVLYCRGVDTNLTAFYEQQLMTNLTDRTIYGTNNAIVRGWNMCAWPYAARSCNGTPGLGFASSAGDRIYLYRNNQYLRIHWDGTEWRNGANVATTTIQEGEGFWYFRRAGTPANWDLE